MPMKKKECFSFRLPEVGNTGYLLYIHNKGDPGAGFVQIACFDYGGHYLLR